MAKPPTWAIVVVGGLLLLGGCGRIQPDDPGSTTSNSCPTAAADVNESVRLGLLEAEWFTESLLAGDMSGAQAHYDNTTFLSELIIIRVDTFLDRCDSYARVEGIYTDMQRASANVETELAQIRRTCRQELAPSGFDC